MAKKKPTRSIDDLLSADPDQLELVSELLDRAAKQQRKIAKNRQLSWKERERQVAEIAAEVKQQIEALGPVKRPRR